MSVRGGKNKILLYVAGAFSIAVVILLYHNASQRLEEMEKSYERCHMNEESLSAQLQVILEYKMRLEKSLQQEKSDHAQTKEELQNKLEEEKQTRERENLEAINKFTALQQQYKLLQSQHEEVEKEYSQLSKQRMSDKDNLETQIKSLTDELKHVKGDKESDIELWKTKYSESEKKIDLAAVENKKLVQQIDILEKENEKLKSDLGQGKSNDKTPITLSRNKPDLDDNLPIPETIKKPEPSKSSTVANKAEKELFPSGNLYLNTSTPMINPEAVQSQDKIPSVLPVPQPKQDSSSLKRDVIHLDENAGKQENVGAKPEEMNQEEQGFANAPINAGVLRPPVPAGFVDQFQHVPEIHLYKERLKQAERNDHGGEVGEDGEPVKIAPANDMSHWRDGEIEGQPFIRHPVGKNEIPRNQIYNYQNDYEARKEDDDDDVDQIDDVDQNLNEKHVDEKPEQHPQQFRLRVPIEEKIDSVMVQPK